MTQRSVPLLIVVVLASLFTTCVPSNVGGSNYRYSPTKIKLANVDELYQFLTYADKEYPLISAHRGGAAPGYPENAIQTFENTFQHQAVLIECDVRMTADSTLVLMHDETLDRTTTGTGSLASIPFHELRKLRLKDSEGGVTGFRIPTLEDALRWGDGKVIFTLDVKRGVPYNAVIEVIRRSNAQAYSILITYNAEQAAAVHQLAPDLMISASIRSADDLLRLGDHGIPDNRLVAFVGNSELDTTVYQFLHGHGILCILGTMGNLDKQAAARGDSVYIRLVERGADILSTDRPVEAGKALNRYRSTHKLTSPFIN